MIPFIVMLYPRLGNFKGPAMCTQHAIVCIAMDTLFCYGN